ncbi:MAG: glycosyltransferase family 2 protein [Bacteroidia bacterium]
MDISVIVPVYRSESTLEELFGRIDNVLGKDYTYEVIFVDDDGGDNSWNVIEQLHAKHPEKITAIKLSKNFGQHNAIMCGMHYTKGKFIVTIDDDLQIPPEELIKLIQKQKETNAELVYGVYGQKEHARLRNKGSEMVQKIFRYVFKTTGDITSFRLIKTEMKTKISQHAQSFIFIDGLLHWHTNKISRVLVEHKPRQQGQSGYSFVKLFALAGNLLFNFTTLPLKLMIGAGFTCAVISLIIAVIFMIRKLVYDVPLGFTAIIVTILFIGSILMLFLGILGEYISRLYANQNQKPQFSVKQIL